MSRPTRENVEQIVDQNLHPFGAVDGERDVFRATFVELVPVPLLDELAEGRHLTQRLLKVVRRDVGELLEFGIRPLQFESLISELAPRRSSGFQLVDDPLTHVLDIGSDRTDVFGALGHDLFAEIALGDSSARGGKCGERARDRGSDHQRRQDGGDDERDGYRGQNDIPPILHRRELCACGVALLLQVLELCVEELPQRIESGLAAVGRCTVDDCRYTRFDFGDEYLGIGTPPCRGRGLDRVHVVEHLGAISGMFPDHLRCGCFDLLPSDIRLKELRIGGDRISTYRRLLITQCGLHLVRRDPHRRDLSGDLVRYGVVAVQQYRAGDGPGQYDCAHDRQHQVLPTLDRRLPLHSVVVRSTRTTAMSSLIPPTDCARRSTSSISALTNSGPGRLA